MPKRIVPLTDMKVQQAKSKDKPVTLFDGGGLLLMVTPSSPSSAVQEFERCNINMLRLKSGHFLHYIFY